jgi:hypothetical protein
MRARLVLLCTIALTTGCTRDNPAFEDSTDTGDTADPDATTTLTNADSESGGQEAPDMLCELQPGVPLEIDLGPAGCADSPEMYDRFHPLVMIEGSTLWVGTCPQGSTGCTPECEIDIPTPLSFSPLDLSNIGAPMDCLHIFARRIDPTNPDVCRFQSVVIESDNGQTRRPVMIGRNTPGVMLPPLDNTSELFGFDPTLVYVENCSCTEYPDECCGDVSTTRYALDIGQPDVVHIGETVAVQVPNNSYQFTTLDAFQLGECGKSVQEAWGLVAN